ncbi:Limbic system-associated membrane protein, partial [Pseudolycoriella hygida]
LTIAATHPKLTLSPSDAEVVHYVNDSHIVNCNAYGTTRDQFLLWIPQLCKVCKKTEMLLLDAWQPAIQNQQFPGIIMDKSLTSEERLGEKIVKVPTEKYVTVVDGLAIKKVSKNDSGEYTCKAFQISTTISNVKEETIRLNIQHKPIPPPRKASADVQFGYLYGVVNLTCEAEAEPAADFTWYRHNKKLNPKVHLIHSQGHESILQILVNDSKAFGDYKCKAENSLGTLERIITLTEGVKPEKPSNLALRGFNSDTFDVDVGAVRKTKERNPMDINGYRFEIIEAEKFRLDGRKWDQARVMILGFEDDQVIHFSFIFLLWCWHFL